MNPYLFPSSLFLFFIFIHLPISLSEDNEQFIYCRLPFNCGKISNITYPFYGYTRPKECGHPEFELYCYNNTSTTIVINSHRYQVLEINQTAQILKISQFDFPDSVCPDKYFNTTLNTSLFKFTQGYQNLTLLYGCKSLHEIPSFKFKCLNDDMDRNIYLTAEATSRDELLQNCSDNVLVPVFESNVNKVLRYPSRLDDVLKQGFEVNWIINITQCQDCVGSEGGCGYNSTTNSFVCFCHDGPCNTTCPASRRRNARQKIEIGVPIAGIIIIATMVVILCCLRRKLSLDKIFFWKRKTKNSQSLEMFLKDHGSLISKRYKYSDIKKMTSSFKEKLGQGAYGDVFRGKLFDGSMVAVKVLRESKCNGEEFINEVASISRTSHVNVVTMLGFCVEDSKRALIYEFMPNGSLEKFIYDEKPLQKYPHLQWETLYKIAVGIARGLEYLHRGCNTRIVHFDIKPHNILLDQDLCPKISDFGLAKLSLKKESIISMMGARGTPGYMAPELFNRNFGGVSHKSDVYSYGMMLLEMVGGRKNIDVGVENISEIYFPQWIHKHLDTCRDLGLRGVITTEDEEIARKMILVGLWCIQMDPSNRPAMNRVLEMLEGSLNALRIPPMPVLTSPSRSQAASSTTSIM